VARGKEQRVDEKDRKEFIQELYRMHIRLMQYTAQKYISDSHHCEDVVQESLAKLIEKTDTLRSLEGAALAGYIVSTVRNTAINHLKKHTPHRTIEIDWAEGHNTVQMTASAEDEVLQKERLGLLTRIWNCLDEETKQVLEGKYILGYSDSELANSLRCKPSSVRMKLTRARRRALALMREADFNDKT